MAQQFPEGFASTLVDGAFTVLDEAGAAIYAADARWLADKLLRGETCNVRERAAAGAAIAHLLNCAEVDAKMARWKDSGGSK